MDVNSKFFRRSVSVVEKFLQTAVVIDDRAYSRFGSAPEAPVGPLPPLPTPMTAVPAPISAGTVMGPSAPVRTVAESPVGPPSPPPTPVTAAPAPISADTITGPSALGSQLLPLSVSAGSTTETANEARASPDDPDPHGIDARQVIDSFAERGIICSVLQRKADEDLTAPDHRAHRLLRAADILIVDWQVHHANGDNSVEETLGFIESAVKENLKGTPQQLRLIVIYTGATNLHTVADSVSQCLESACGTTPPKDGDFAFRTGAMRIVILGKPSRSRGFDQKDQQVKSDSELCNRTIQEFTAMTAGLISNVAIESLAEVRRATHGIISRFGQHLDAPFLPTDHSWTTQPRATPTCSHLSLRSWRRSWRIGFRKNCCRTRVSLNGSKRVLTHCPKFVRLLELPRRKRPDKRYKTFA